VAGQVKPRRVRPAIRRLAIWTLPVLVLIAAWQVWDGAEARRLQRALAPFLGAGPTVPGLPAGADAGAVVLPELLSDLVRDAVLESLPATDGFARSSPLPSCWPVSPWSATVSSSAPTSS